MGRWLPKEQRLELGEKVVLLRDVENLEWKDIAERLGLYSGSNAVYHYKKGKEAEKIAEGKLKFKEIEPFASKYGIERGYVWLYENGFKQRVPIEVQSKIEDGKLGIGARPKKTRLRFEPYDGRSHSKRIARTT